ncbi:MAG: Stp1/IreP family PP2C-type Ser/Thr phosphatase [Chloroflexi bacterium]|nr:MAG: Stp1/IreP family PP2C-type Ser/Thr phosphatase [Chloroflexota bacterium]
MSNSGQFVHLKSSARTSTGQVRQNNEDNVHLMSTETSALAIVADGMGGAAAGEEASRLAVEAIRESLFHDSDTTLDMLVASDNIAELLYKAVQAANLEIMKIAKGKPEFKGMGTTVTMAFIDNTTATIAHVGDSRAYLVDGTDGSIEQVTNDHSFVQALLNAGHITEQQAEEHPMRNVLYRALGQAEDVDIDIYYVALRIGDRLVLCSDGLTRHVDAKEIAQAALAEEDPAVSSQRLIDLTNSRGGEDNVSVIVISVERGPDIPDGNQQTYVDFSESDTIDFAAVRPKLKGNDPRESEMPGSPSSDVDMLSQQIITAEIDIDHNLASKMRAERDSDRIATGEHQAVTLPPHDSSSAEAHPAVDHTDDTEDTSPTSGEDGEDDDPAEGFDKSASEE